MRLMNESLVSGSAVLALNDRNRVFAERLLSVVIGD